MYSDEEIRKMMKYQWKLARYAVVVFFLTFLMMYFFGKH